MQKQVEYSDAIKINGTNGNYKNERSRYKTSILFAIL